MGHQQRQVEDSADLKIECMKTVNISSGVLKRGFKFTGEEGTEEYEY